MKMENKSFIFAINVTYDNNTFNTLAKIEYKHTGLRYFLNKNHFTENKEIADKWRSKGKKVTVKSGYYFIDRIAIPIINAEGKKDWWYITNPGDYYRVNKTSKACQKNHSLLSNEEVFEIWK